jgi:hypothetical protein
VTSMDGNFALYMKQGKTKRSDDDPELASGAAYMVEEGEYQEFLGDEEAKNPDTSGVRNVSIACILN